MNSYSGLQLLILEDDYWQGDMTRQAILAAFPGSKVDQFTTECEFYEQIETLSRRPPRIIVMDVKLPWDEMGENRKNPPAEAIKEGDRRAGLRCWKRIASRAEFSETRVLFYSHILDDDLEAEIRALPSRPHSLSKFHSATGRSSLQPLLEKLRELLQET